MNKTLLTLMVTATVAFFALPSFAAADCGKCDHKMADGKTMAMAAGGHEGMQMDGGMLMLPEQTVDGVTAMVHLKDVKAAMAQMGMKHTHHFMVMFKDAAGKAIDAEVVALKITDPSGKEAEPVALMAMQGHAGADVILATPGAYTFKVASKLANGKKVQYLFHYTLK